MGQVLLGRRHCTAMSQAILTCLAQIRSEALGFNYFKRGAPTGELSFPSAALAQPSPAGKATSLYSVFSRAFVFSNVHGSL